MTPITSDSPGFLVNRVLFPYLGEAVLMVAEGYDVATMDKQVRRFGMPMGPLQLLDQVGLDVALHVAAVLHAKVTAQHIPVRRIEFLAVQGAVLLAVSAFILARPLPPQQEQGDVPRQP